MSDIPELSFIGDHFPLNPTDTIEDLIYSAVNIEIGGNNNKLTIPAATIIHPNSRYLMCVFFTQNDRYGTPKLANQIDLNSPLNIRPVVFTPMGQLLTTPNKPFDNATSNDFIFIMNYIRDMYDKLPYIKEI